MGVDSNTTVVFQGIDNNYMRGRWVAQSVSKHSHLLSP